MKKLFSLLLILLSIIECYSYFGNYVVVGDLNNPANSHGTGSINYSYEIGQFEVTNEEYCKFLNNIGYEVADSLGLWTPLMEQHFLGGIKRIANGSNCAFQVKEGYAKLPVGGVTWESAIRFVNWLNYNSDLIELHTSENMLRPFTDGTDKYGAYDTRNINQAKRNKSATYWLPNENEWLKACYYSPKGWAENEIYKNINVFNHLTGWSLPYPHLLSTAKGVVKSYYGTVNQQGNLAEWVEDSSQNFKKALGGSLIRPVDEARMYAYEGDFSNKSIASFGFRVCRTDNAKKRAALPLLPDGTNKIIPKNEKELYTDKNGGKYVKVENPGNQGDIVNQYRGRVNYPYLISQYELSNEQYCRFLNSVASESDPFGLYNKNMSQSVCGGIDRYKENDRFVYQTKAGWEKKPVTYISYYDLVRYANWLHYGCPNTGKSELGTTEGTNEKGAYNTQDFGKVLNGEIRVYADFGKRNKGAKYWIPDEDEWYKAAYYDPTIIGNRKYWDYPMRTDNPTSDMANFMSNNTLSVGEPYFVTDVDSFANYKSYYGTQQQGGNVWEWIESWQYGNVGNRGLRGGSWSYSEYGLNAINTDPGGLNNINYVFGGRLCASIDDNGWQPVNTPLNIKLKEYVNGISETRFFMLFSAVTLLMLAMVILIAVILIRSKKHDYRKN